MLFKLQIFTLMFMNFQSFCGPPMPTMCKNEDRGEGQWATDDIPDFLNAMRREVEAEKQFADAVRTSPGGTVAVSLAAPPPQNLLAKLQELRLKNPVSGLMEYAQYLGQNCEFLLLDQSGPSHDPRSVFLFCESSQNFVAESDCWPVSQCRARLKMMDHLDSSHSASTYSFGNYCQ